MKACVSLKQSYKNENKQQNFFSIDTEFIEGMHRIIINGQTGAIHSLT